MPNAAPLAVNEAGTPIGWNGFGRRAAAWPYHASTTKIVWRRVWASDHSSFTDL
jgi:hypothetical protein